MITPELNSISPPPPQQIGTMIEIEPNHWVDFVAIWHMHIAQVGDMHVLYVNNDSPIFSGKKEDALAKVQLIITAKKTAYSSP